MGRSREKDYDRAGMHRNLDIMSLLLQNIHSYHRELMSSVRHECVKGFAVNRIDDVIDCNWHQTLVLVDSAVCVKSCYCSCIVKDVFSCCGQYVTVMSSIKWKCKHAGMDQISSHVILLLARSDAALYINLNLVTFFFSLCISHILAFWCFLCIVCKNWS